MKSLSVAVVRDVVMMVLGAGGIAHELWLVPSPNPIRVAVSVMLVSGTATLNGWWLLQWLRNLPAPVTSPTAGPASPPPSPSSPPRS